MIKFCATICSAFTLSFLAAWVDRYPNSVDTAAVLGPFSHQILSGFFDFMGILSGCRFAAHGSVGPLSQAKKRNIENSRLFSCWHCRRHLGNPSAG
ncbi:hypothetical protein ABGV42_14290 [Paenibacillus pabuli]|uniref:hypothetical protein n=1 Tax=Paenibacillus pabuli TaxID=1472 RepID=UPI003241CD2F